MNRLELHDEDGDRITLSDFNDDTPESARGPSPHSDAKLTVYQHTIMDNPATDLSDIAEEGVSVLLDAEGAQRTISWLMQFFNGVNDVVTLTMPQAMALRATVKGHTVADIGAHAELLEAALKRIEEARGG